MRQKNSAKRRVKKENLSESRPCREELFSFIVVKQNFSIYFSVNVLLILFLRQEKYEQPTAARSGFRIKSGRTKTGKRISFHKKSLPFCRKLHKQTN